MPLRSLFEFMRALLAALALQLCFAAAPASAANGSYELTVLSSRPQVVSGGDMLVRLTSPANAPIRVTLDSRDVSRSFLASRNGEMIGLISGLREGTNKLEAHVGGRVVARLHVINHRISGPIFSGPHQTPFICETEINGLGPARDVDCNASTTVTYYYKSTTTVARPAPGGPRAPAAPGDFNLSFKPYDLAAPRPADMAQITMTDGKIIDYIVRREVGVVNRAVYDIQFLHRPGAPLPTPWSGLTSEWNGRLVYLFGGGCVTGYRQGRLSLIGSANQAFISQGYAVATSTLNIFLNNCNDRVSAETVSMVKERFIEQFGVPVHTIGAGASGASMQQHLIAQNYPGLLDGIMPNLSFPDHTSMIAPVVDCSVLDRAFRDQEHVE